MSLFLRAVSRCALPSAASRRLLSTLYAPTHEYVKISGNIGTVGITDHAAGALGDIVYIELPPIGKSFKAGESFGSVESVKAASDVYAPVSGEVVEVNSALESNPSTVNESPFVDGWFVKMKLAADVDVKKLLDEAAYSKVKESEAH